MINQNLAAILWLMFSAPILHAQSSDLSLISSGGNIAQTGALYLTYSIGEPCITYTQSGLHWVTEGFQQPDKINLTSIKTNSLLKNSFQVFPNPVSNELYIEFTPPLSRKQVQITNVIGKIIHFEAMEAGHTMTLNLHHLLPGIYFLNIHDFESTSITQPFIKI